MNRTVEGVVLLNLVEERIRALWKYRQWWRTHRWAEYPLRRVETDAELRALVRIARKARQAARPVDVAGPVFDAEGTLVGEYPDPTLIPYHDYQAAS